MKSYIDMFKNSVDPNFLKKHTVSLMEKELPQTTPAMHNAVDYICDLLKDNGFEPERVDFPADGETICYDLAIPLAWDLSYGKLTVESQWDGDCVIADYEKEPFAVVRYSVSTPPEGIRTKLVLWDEMMNGKDVEGAFVLVPYGEFSTAKILVPILDRGAIGFIGGTVVTKDEELDSTHWINGATETNSWCVNADDRDFIGFSVTPRIHKKLEEACKNGEVLLKAETDAHRYVGTMPGVTALLPGEDKRELWVMAHTAEPLEDDNNAGVIGTITSLIAIRDAIDAGKLPLLKYSIRILLSPEAYGLSAFADYFGGVLYDRCIGAVNIDGIPSVPAHDEILLQFSSSPVPFYGNFIMEGVWYAYAASTTEKPYIRDWWGDHWGDDCFLSDVSIGLPTLMPESVFYSWHNSTQRYGHIDYAYFARSLSVYIAMIAAIAACETQKLEAFMPTAKEYAKKRLKGMAETCPPREGTNARARINHRLGIELGNLRSFSNAGVSADIINSVCDEIEEYVNSLNPIPAEEKTEPTPVYDSLENVVIARNCIGAPRDLRRVTPDRRYHPFSDVLMQRVFSACDGKRTLKDLITQAEWENKKALTEEQISNFVKTLELCAEFEYIKLDRN